jgi:hypothetical protein
VKNVFSSLPTNVPFSPISGNHNPRNAGHHQVSWDGPEHMLLGLLRQIKERQATHAYILTRALAVLSSVYYPVSCATKNTPITYYCCMDPRVMQTVKAPLSGLLGVSPLIQAAFWCDDNRWARPVDDSESGALVTSSSSSIFCEGRQN